MRGPDVVAPGTGIVSLRVPGSTLDEEYPAARVGDAFFRGSGTSQSAAVVSGIAARLLGQRPGLTNDQLKALLRAGAVDLADPPSADGAGRVDLARSEALPSPGPSVQRWPVATPDLQKLFKRGNREMETGATNWNGRRWSGMKWSGRRWSGMKWSGMKWNGMKWLRGRMGRRELSRFALPALAGAIAVAAVALFVFVVADLPSYGLGVHVPWWALAAAFAVTELFVVHAHVRGSAHSLSVSELPLILGLLLSSPQELVIAQVLGPAVVLMLTRGHSPLKLVFNLAQFGLTACLATITLHALAPVPQVLGPGLWAAVFAAVLVSALMGATLVFAAIALAEGVFPSRRMAMMMGADLLVALTNTSVGLAGATLVAGGPPRRLAAARPGLHPAARLPRLPLRAHQAREPGVPLRRRALALARAGHRVRARGPAAAHERDVPGRGRRDRAVLGRDAAAHRARPARARDPHGAARSLSRRRPAGRSSATRSRQVLVEREHASGLLAHCMEARGIRQALIAPVPGETRLTGVMVLGDRVGASSSFTGEDVRLFETLANHAGLSLEYDRLEQAVTRMRELQERLEVQAFADSLTGLGNRAQFLRRLGSRCAARRARRPCCSSTSTTSR
jgi:hypothetical protein